MELHPRHHFVGGSVAVTCDDPACRKCLVVIDGPDVEAFAEVYPTVPGLVIHQGDRVFRVPHWPAFLQRRRQQSHELLAVQDVADTDGQTEEAADRIVFRTAADNAVADEPLGLIGSLTDAADAPPAPTVSLVGGVARF